MSKIKQVITKLLCWFGFHKWMLVADRVLPFAVYEAKLECDRCPAKRIYREDGLRL